MECISHYLLHVITIVIVLTRTIQLQDDMYVSERELIKILKGDKRPLCCNTRISREAVTEKVRKYWHPNQEVFQFETCVMQ